MQSASESGKEGSGSGARKRAVPRELYIQPASRAKLAINSFFARLCSPWSFSLVLETRALNTVRALAIANDERGVAGARVVVANPDEAELAELVEIADKANFKGLSLVAVPLTSHELLSSLSSRASPSEEQSILPADFTSFDAVWLDYNGLMFAPSRGARLRREDIAGLLRDQLLRPPSAAGTAVLAVTQSLRSASFAYASEAADSLVLLVEDVARQAGLQVRGCSLVEYGAVVTQLFVLGWDRGEGGGGGGAGGGGVTATTAAPVVAAAAATAATAATAAAEAAEAATATTAATPLPPFAEGKDIPGTRFVSQYVPLKKKPKLLPLGAALKASADAVVAAVSGEGEKRAKFRILASDGAPLLPVVTALMEANDEAAVETTLLCQSRLQRLFAERALSQRSGARDTHVFEVRLRAFLDAHFCGGCLSSHNAKGGKLVAGVEERERPRSAAQRAAKLTFGEGTDPWVGLETRQGTIWHDKVSAASAQGYDCIFLGASSARPMKYDQLADARTGSWRNLCDV